MIFIQVTRASDRKIMFIRGCRIYGIIPDRHNTHIGCTLALDNGQHLDVYDTPVYIKHQVTRCRERIQIW